MTETKTKNVLEKLAQARFELSQAKLKKTGRNLHLKYSYFELDDFLPAVVEICAKNGIATMFGMNEAFASLQIINTENTADLWEFKIPVAKAGVQGGQEIQNLGSQITYLRRYLLMTAFEIAEASDIERVTGEAGNEEGLKLEDDETDRIADAKTVEELNAVCKDLIAKKGMKYKKLIIDRYNSMKESLQEAQA